MTADRPAKQPLLLLVPEMYRTSGGIATYMKRLAEIAVSYPDVAVDCVALHGSDYVEPHPERAVSYRTFRGSRSNKFRFLFQSIQTARGAAKPLAVVGHTGLLPVALVLKKLGLIRDYAIILHGIEAWKALPAPARTGARHAAAIVSTTQFTASEFVQHNGVNPELVRVIPLGLAENEAEELSTRAKRDVCNILVVGRVSSLERYKGVDTLIDAMAQLEPGDPPAKLTVVGAGDDLPTLQARAAALGVTDRVEFRGRVPDAELEAAYRNCDVFALPSRAEGFGLVFLEAMRHGKPCIGGRHGGTPEVFTDGLEGLLVEHGNVVELTKAIRTLAGSAELRQRMGAAALDRIRRDYLFPSMQRNWHRLLRELSRGSR